MTKQRIHKMVLTAMFLAIGFVLPTITMQIREIGNMLLPMHIPVLLCSFLCGPYYAAMIGLLLPIMRSLVFSMPVFYPNAVAMSVELLSYALICGLVFGMFKKKNLISIYVSLITAMIGGRIIWGCLSAVLYYFLGAPKTFGFFIARSVVEAVPGIILQLLLIPAIVMLVSKIRKNS